MADYTGNSSNNSFTGTTADETISGLGGNDVLNGGGGNDVIDGGDGTDSLNGGSGNDTLTGGAGNDTLVGGTGTDTAVFTTAVAAASAGGTAIGSWVSGNLRITTAGEGTDTLSTIEQVTFNGRTFQVDIAGQNVVAQLGNDTAAAGENDASVTGSVLSNDYDVDSVLTVSGIVGGSLSSAVTGVYGALTLNADGTYSYVPNGAGAGDDVFTYQVNDHGTIRTATLTITVSAVNDAPVTTGDSGSTDEDTPLDGQLHATDEETATVDLVFALDTDASHGTVTVNADGSFTYTPTGDYAGPDSFTYTVTDLDGATTTSTFEITVDPVNDVPVTSNNSDSTDEDTALNGSLTASDVEDDAADLVFALDAQASHGTVTVNADGSFVYAPHANYAGADSFTYTVTDLDGGVTTSTFNITVDPVNDAPVTSDNSASTDEDTVLNGALTATDVEDDAADLEFALDTDASHGTVTVNVDGTFTYTPTGDYAGPDSFTYTVTDLDGATTTSTFEITVDPVNDVPVTSNNSDSTDEDTALNGSLTASDVEDDAADLVFALDAQASHGTVTVNADGSFVYAPAANYAGADSFTYTVTDLDGGVTTSTFNITVAPVNDAPVTSDNSASTDEDTVLNGALTATDVEDASGALVFALGLDATNGTVTVDADGTFTYTPDANYAGADSFTYTVTDLDGATTTSTFNITVDPVNDAPVAQDIAGLTIDEDAVAPLVIAWDASDAEGSPTQIALVNGEAMDADGVAVTGGVVTVNVDGDMVFTPNADFSGDVSFTFAVTDGTDLSDPATVDLHVNAINDAPVADAETLNIAEDAAGTVVWSGSDVDSVGLSVSAVNGEAMDIDGVVVTGGVVTVNVDGDLVFTPNANYDENTSFTYTLTDGAAESNAATVTVNITPVNDAPVLDAVAAVNITEDDAATAIVWTASDVEGSDLTVATVNGEAMDADGVVVTGGVVTVNVGGDLVFTADANYDQNTSFDFTVTDGAAESNVQTVTVNIAAVNDLPVTSDNSASTDEDIILNGALTATDIEDAAVDLIFALDADASNGTVTVNANGTFTYTPAADYSGPDSFSYTVTDLDGGVTTSTFEITVNPVNDAPIAQDITGLSIDEDAVAPLVIPWDASDAEFDATEIASINGEAMDADGVAVTGGVVTVNVDGDMVFTPDADFNGDASFTFTVTDGTDESAPANVELTVNSINDEPVTSDNSASTDEDTVLNGALTATDVEDDAADLEFALDTDATNGTVTVNANGTFTYTPDSDFFGSDSFTYTVTDLDGATVTSTFNITVDPVNDAPVAQDIPGLSIDEDAVAPLVIAWDASDAEGDDTTIASVNGEAMDADGVVVTGGVVTVNVDGDMVFTPDANFYGDASFTFTVTDGTDESAPASVELTVNSINDDPVTSDNSASTDEDIVLNGQLVASDIETATVDLIFALDVDASHGTVTVNTDGSFSYTPAANYSGADSFSYTVQDEDGGIVTSTFTITVDPVNDNPVTSNNSASVDEDTALNGSLTASDVEDDAADLVFALDAPASHGTVTVNADGSFVYAPTANYAGADSFTYTVTDLDGGVTTSTFNITVDPVNDAPVTSDNSASTDEDTVLNGALTATDAEDDAADLEFALVVDAINGTVTVNPDGTFTYTPDADFFGSDSFTYNVTDLDGATTTSTFNITVDPVNDAPVAQDIAGLTIDEDAVAPLVIAWDASDAEGDDTSIASVNGEAMDADGVAVTGGVVTVNVDGDMVFTPEADFNGDVSFTFTVTDGTDESDPATVDLHVNAINDAPVANAYGPLATSEDAILTGTVAGTDVENDALTFALTAAVDGLTFNGATGAWSFDPTGVAALQALNVGQSTTVSFTYTANDGDLDSDPVTVQIVVSGAAEVVNGTGGADTLIGGAGDDIITAGAGADDVLAGGGADVVYGDAGADTILGGAGDDELHGGADNDEISGGSGADTIFGDAGSDYIVGGGDNDTLSGGAGADSLYGGLGNDSLSGGDDGDKLYGDDGADTLDGGASSDYLYGGFGNDILIGGTGNDRLRGEDGADTFVITNASMVSSVLGQSIETDTIYDFSVADGDRIDLSQIDANINLDGNQSFTFVAAFSRVAGQAMLQYDSVANVTNLRLDVDGDGRIDYQARISGNVTGTSGSILTGSEPADQGGWIL